MGQNGSGFVVKVNGMYQFLPSLDGLDGDAYVLFGRRNGRALRRVLVNRTAFPKLSENLTDFGERAYLNGWSSNAEVTHGFNPDFQFLKNRSPKKYQLRD